MNIAVSIPTESHPSDSLSFQFCFRLLAETARQQPQHRFFIIDDNFLTNPDILPANTEIISRSSSGGPGLLSGLWRNIQLPVILKKIKAGLFLSLDGKCLRNLKLPQCILVIESKKLSGFCASRANTLAVLTATGKKEILNRYQVSDKSIHIIRVAAGDVFHPTGSERKEQIKEKYTGGYDFFLFNGSKLTRDDFVILLKAFSGFKKRQKSSLKLLILSAFDPLLEKNLLNYKYKNDVSIVNRENERDIALITAAAYAAVLFGDYEINIIPALEALRSTVPVIVAGGSAIGDTFGNAVLSTLKKEPKEIGEMMMRLYTDEQYRLHLTEKGKSVAETFTWNRSADLLWQAMQNALT